VSQPKEATVEGYFFAGRNAPWLVVSVSLLTSCIFSPYVLALTPSGWASRLSIAYGIVSVIVLAVLGRFLVPIYLNADLHTLPEYFEKRYNRACRFFLSGLSIAGNVLVRLTILLFAGTLLISRVAGADAFSSLLFLLTVTGLYVVIGGLRAEMYVGVAQVVLILLGVAGFAWWVASQSNGTGLVVRGFGSVDFFGSGEDGEFSWNGVVWGLPILGIWFWGADQMAVQKILSARNVRAARSAATASGILQILPVLVFVLLGSLFAAPYAGAFSGESLQGMISEGFLPRVLHAGIVVAIAAAFTASVAALFNSTSMLITFDFYRSFKPDASDRKLVLVGRLSSVLIWLCSVLLIPVAQTMDAWLCLELFKVFAEVAAMISALLLAGLFARRFSALSALVTLCIATGIIFARAILVIVLRSPLVDSGLLDWFVQAEFLHFAGFVFLLSIACLVLVDRLEWVHHLLHVGGTSTRPSS